MSEWTSDWDRLQEAFTDLNRLGIRTYPNFWCCGSCASGAIYKKYAADPAPGVAGAVYFDEQDAEHALDGHGLTLRCLALPAAPDGNGADTAAIGRSLARALTINGLLVDWNGDPNQVVTVPVFEVTIDEIPEGEGSALHETYGADADEEWKD